VVEGEAKGNIKFGSGLDTGVLRLQEKARGTPCGLWGGGGGDSVLVVGKDVWCLGCELRVSEPGKALMGSSQDMW